jgi:hypothetical protein
MEKFENSNTPETISSTIFGSAAILQTGECPLAGFKTVKVKPALLSGTKALLWRAIMGIPLST